MMFLSLGYAGELLRENQVMMERFKSDLFQISPAASSEILHHTVWRTWLFIAYSDEIWKNVVFELGRETVKHFTSLGSWLVGFSFTYHITAVLWEPYI